MKIGHKLTVAALVTSTAVAVVLFMSPAPKAQAQGQGRGVTLSGTIYGTLDWYHAGGPAWVGHALISFDNQPPLIATFVDSGPGPLEKKNGIYGTETISLTFLDGSGSFEIQGQFESNASSAPGLYQFHETGSIEPGTGNYANVSGQVSIQGQAVNHPTLWPPSQTGGDPMWISEIHGVILLAR